MSSAPLFRKALRGNRKTAPPGGDAVYHFKNGLVCRLDVRVAGHARCYSDLSMFQKIGVAGPSSTPVSDFRQALGARYCPSGI
jgi:hypothetical protein